MKLSRAEARSLAEETVPLAIRQFVDRSPVDIGARASAYQKVAEAARAERHALIEVLALDVVRAHYESARTPEQGLRLLEKENRELRRALSAKHALPAMAVYAE